ncbi:MAG TPA: hypothetical protein VM243_09665 [Phycisphaerae bacterium]|nr:hypothetical protein [Phycisphaerae bacterium]
MSELARIDWRFGQPLPFWVLHNQHVAQFAEKHKLVAVPSDRLPGGAPVHFGSAGESEGSPAAHLLPVPWPNPCGGLKAPHLHLGRDLFILTHKQWEEFTAPIFEQYAHKLGAAKTVPFEQVMEMDEAFSGLPDPPRR